LEYYAWSGLTKRVPLSVNYIDGTTVSLKFDKLDFNQTYKLRFSSLKDYSGLNITSEKDTDTSVTVIMGN
jgi:hypothetical protein